MRAAFSPPLIPAPEAADPTGAAPAADATPDGAKPAGSAGAPTGASSATVAEESAPAIILSLHAPAPATTTGVNSAVRLTANAVSVTST